MNTDLGFFRALEARTRQAGWPLRWIRLVGDAPLTDVCASDILLLELDRVGSGATRAFLEWLESGDSSPVVIAWSRRPLPSSVAFELGRYGVRCLLEDRPAPGELLERVATVLSTRPVVAPQVRSLVGLGTMPSLVAELRDVLLEQASDLVGNNRSQMAKLLGVSRQNVQQMLRRRREKPAASKPGIASQPPRASERQVG